MWDPGTLAAAAVLLVPSAPPATGLLIPEPLPRPGDACVAPLHAGPVLYLGEGLRACPGPQRPTPPLRLLPVPQERPGTQPSDE